MHEEVREWLEKAEGDFNTAMRESAVTDAPNYDAVFFHAQQCVEKLMKGVLAMHSVTPPHTHDLAAISSMVTAVAADWEWPQAELDWLTRGAVQYRYPLRAATTADGERSVEMMARLREALLPLFGS